MVMVWGCMVVAPFRMGINFLWPDAAGLFLYGSVNDGKLQGFCEDYYDARK
jgi:hypothetical protein